MIFKRKPNLAVLDQKLPLDKAISFARILIIDNDDTFPVKLFQHEGYNIQKWDKVESLGDLESGKFDIIVLDIYDVAKEYSHKDGLGILEYLKTKNPSQIIVAYSGQSFDLSKKDFWKLADDMLSKPVDYLKCKDIIDRLIEDKFNVRHYTEGLKVLAAANGADAKQIKRIEEYVASSIVERKKIDPAQVFSGFSKTAELTSEAFVIVSSILKLLGIV